MRPIGEDGHGRAAYEPAVMVALLLYCWARGTRSSRAIERACVEDVACRVIAAQQRPDHATIARFVVRHERALGELFGEVLALCADAGLATVGVIAIDGTKVAANANRDRTMDYEQTRQDDRAGADHHRRRRERAPRRGARRRAAGRAGQSKGRQGWLREAKRRLDERRAERSQADSALTSRAPQRRQATAGRGAVD